MNAQFVERLNHHRIHRQAFFQRRQIATFHHRRQRRFTADMSWRALRRRFQPVRPPPTSLASVAAGGGSLADGCAGGGAV
ncbi:MAG: hypothetical protein R2873_24485 [Caldilineaceae bacterium]